MLCWENLASVNLIAAKVTGADPKVLAAVIRGPIMEIRPADPFRTINIPVLILNDKADVANQKLGALLKAIPTAGTAAADGDLRSAPYQPRFQQAAVTFLKKQWQQT